MDFLNKQADHDTHDSAAYLAGTTCLLVHKSSHWILDSGASDHICHDINIYYDYKPLNDAEHKITIPDGRKVQVEYIGTVLLKNGLRLHSVLYVPNFHFHLNSVQKLCKDMHCNIFFSPETCHTHDHLMKRSWLLGKSSHGTHYIDEKTIGNIMQIQINKPICISLVWMAMELLAL